MLGKLEAENVSLQEKVWRGWWRRNSWRIEVTRDQFDGWVTNNDGEWRREGSPEEV